MSKGRVLAVDIRASYFGYAVFEIPVKLLAFGIATANSSHKARERMTVFIKRFRPSVIVLRKLPRKTRRNRQSHAVMTRAICKVALSASIPVKYVNENNVREFFDYLGKQNKYEIATLTAETFPDLAWRLPSKRKLYQPEPMIMSLFDAVALGTVYLNVKS